MRLFSPEFERKFRALYRAELRAAPHLKKQVRRERKTRGAEATGVTRYLLSLLILLSLFVMFVGRGGGLEFGLALISIWTAGTVFRKQHALFQTLFGSEDLVVLNFLPLSDAQIFRVLWRKFWTRFLWVFLELTLFYLALGILEASPALAYSAALLAGVQTVLMLALSLHCAAFLQAFPLGVLGGLLRAAAVFLMFAGAQFGEFTQTIIRVSYWFFPTGWVNYVFAQCALHSDWVSLGLLIPIGAMIYGAKFSLVRLRSLYSLEGFEIVPSIGATALEKQPQNRKGATEIEESIQQRNFLAGIDWSRGRLERLISRFFKGRDRVVLEFLVAENPRWSHSLKTGFWFWMIGISVVWIFGQYGGFAVFFPAYLLATMVLPIFGGEWRGLQQFPTAGVFLPAFATFPITFNEIAKTLFKVNCIRTLAASPLVISFGIVAAWKLGHPPVAGAALTLKFLALFLALQPVMNLLPLSKATNSTSRMKLAWIFFFLPLAIALFTLSFLLFFIESLTEGLVIYAVIVAVSVIIFLAYRRAFRREKFDLLSKRVSGFDG